MMQCAMPNTGRGAQHLAWAAAASSPCFGTPRQRFRTHDKITSLASHRRADRAHPPGPDDQPLIAADRIFIKHGYSPTPAVIDYLHSLDAERVLVCGIQADTCVLAAGFALFDAGLSLTLIADFVVGSSLDRSGGLGLTLWRHHFGSIVSSHLGSLPGE